MDNLNMPPEKYEDLKKNLPIKKKIEEWNNQPNNKWILKTKKEEQNQKIVWFIAIIFLAGTFGFLYFSNIGAYQSTCNPSSNFSALQISNNTCICNQTCNPIIYLPDSFEVNIKNST